MGAFISPLTGHLDVGLTNYIQRYQNNQLFADKIAPRVPIPRQSDKYWIFGRENQNVLQQTLRAAGDTPQKVVRSMSNANFFADSHALMADLPDESTYNFDLGDLRQAASEDLMDKILLDKEIRLANLLAAANISNGVTLAGASQYSDYATSDPLTDVETAKGVIAQSGVNANWLIMGDPVFRKLRNHPSIVERFKYTSPGGISEKQLAEVFDIDNVYVGSAVVLDKNGNVSFVWGKNIILGYTKGAGPMDAQAGPPVGNMGDMSACKTFVWTGAPGTIGGLGTIIERKAPQAAKSDLVSVDFYYDQRIVAEPTIYGIFSAVA